MNYSLMFYPWCKSSGWGVGEGVDREKDKESSKCIMHRRVYMSGLLLQKVFFFFVFPTTLHQLCFVNISWARTPRGRQISCNLPDLPSMSGAVVFLYPSKCYWVCKLWKIGINLDPVQHLWNSQYGWCVFVSPPRLCCCWIAQFSGTHTHSWPRCFGIMWQ